ncbi:hypothetical protein STCU_11715 [Strigomonas culicis]|uniref:Uncharacterized protein n=1 Tax=Strigomonas culicis TaxID=28005 RepID=S9THN7_9TRYP|nr:hypothetical protein STCU_11715 [Strigomonas culicis]|eukprot:EPY15853.1 hypothetical protein STCU_11715 [Strigomonas culicis]
MVLLGAQHRDEQRLCVALRLQRDVDRLLPLAEGHKPLHLPPQRLALLRRLAQRRGRPLRQQRDRQRHATGPLQLPAHLLLVPHEKVREKGAAAAAALRGRLLPAEEGGTAGVLDDHVEEEGEQRAAQRRPHHVQQQLPQRPRGARAARRQKDALLRVQHR